jgi:hypothetical protein
MPAPSTPTLIYHITNITNLESIIANGLQSDVQLLAQAPHAVIGYDHIKKRRMEEIAIPCCDDRFVGEFVPFYYCPRSPMLFTINMGRTGLPVGSQNQIIHLVSTVNIGVNLGNAWAISDGNAGAFHTSFSDNLSDLSALEWDAINAHYWSNCVHQKAAEFLVADQFP